jgi:hypothetical protein
MDLLKENPNCTHVIDDAEGLFQDKSSYGVLRSALWGQTGKDGYQERVVVWQKDKVREEVLFKGGIIVLANKALPNVPELRALTTRIPCLQFSPSNEELAAYMRKLAKAGHRHGPFFLEPASCLEVVAAIIEKTRQLKRPLDLRLFVNACNDRLFYEQGMSESHWLTLLESTIKGRVVAPEMGCGVRARTKENELAVVRRIVDLPNQERLDAWKKETGKSPAAFYRRLAEHSQDSHYRRSNVGCESRN